MSEPLPHAELPPPPAMATPTVLYTRIER
jgi:hypothetical protein